jgi:hypothetical protein
MRKTKRLTDAYRFPGFIPQQMVAGIFGDPRARVIKLNRIEKKRVVRDAVKNIEIFMTARFAESEIFRAATQGFILNWRFVASTAGDAGG